MWGAEVEIAGVEETSPEPFFAYPFDLVRLGYEHWKSTGEIPDPEKLKRIDPRWRADLVALDRLIEEERQRKSEHDG